MSGVTFDTSAVTKWISHQPGRDRAHKQALNAIAIKGEQVLKSRSSKISVSSKLYNSIFGKVERDNAIIGSNADYAAAALETGRKPGKAPPIGALQMWAQRKLGDKNAAFAVAKNIARYGTKKHQRKGPKMITSVMDYLTKTFIPKEMTKLLDVYVK